MHVIYLAFEDIASDIYVKETKLLENEINTVSMRTHKFETETREIFHASEMIVGQE